MALGAITLGEEVGRSGPISFLQLMSFAGDSSYPTGGTAAFQATVRAEFKGDVEVLAVIPQDCGLFLPSYDKTNDKLLVRNLTDGSEVADTTNLSGTTFNVLVLMK